MATAGSIVIDLLLKTGSFETDSKRAEQRMKQLERKINKMAKTAALYAVGAASGFALAIKSAANYADEMGRAAERTSVSAKSFSELSYAVKDVSLSQGELERVLRRSTEAINHGAKGSGKQAEALKALGISAYDATGQLKTADEMLLDMTDRFSKLEPGARKTGLVLDLFGQQLGQKVIPLLNKGREGVKELTDEANKFGLVVDDKAAKAANEFNTNLGKMTDVVKGIAVSFGNELLPVLNDYINYSLEAAEETDGVLSSARELARDGELERWIDMAGHGFSVLIDVAIFLAKTVGVVSSAFRAAVADGEVAMRVLNKAQMWNWFDGDATQELKDSLQNRNDIVSKFNDDFFDLLQYQGDKYTQAWGKTIEKRQFDSDFVGPMMPTVMPGIKVSPGGDPKKPSKGSKKSTQIDEGERLIKQMNERIALLGKETEYEQLLAKIGVDSIKFKTKSQKEMALGLAKTLDMRVQEIEFERTLKELREQQSITQTQFMRDLAAFGKGDSVRELNSELARVEDRYRAIIDARRNSPLGLSEDELAQIKESLDIELEMVRQHHADKKAIQEDWRLGAQDALANYADDVSNVYGSMSDTVAAAFKGMEDSMVDFIKTGKLDFKSLADSIISDLIRITVQQSLMGPLAGFMGGQMGGIAGLFGFSSGGYTGDGGKYEPAGIVHKGEGVLSQEEIKALGGPTGFNSLRKAISGPRHSMGGMAGRPTLPPFPASASQSNVAVSVTINSDGTTKTQAPAGYEKLAKEIGEYVDSRFQELQRQSYRSGGMAWQAKQGGF